MTRHALPLAILLLLALVSVPGCQKKPVAAALPPGALNTFDADTYRILSDAHAAVQSLTDQARAGQVTLDVAQKTIVNRIVRDTNLADTLYQAYHAGGAQNTAALSQAVQTVLGDLATLAQLVPQNGGKAK